MNIFTKLDDVQAIIDVIPSPVFVKNREHRIVLANGSACAFFGHSYEVLLASSDFDLFPDEEVRIFHEADDRVFLSGKDHENEEQVTDAGGGVRSVITRKRRVRLGADDYLVAVITDVTPYREAEAHNRYLAFHDTLTGLPNRALLNERIDQILLRARRSGEQCALIYIDLDRFKEINDTHGHQAGDELIRDFAGRISAIVRASDTVARLGGDEFAILLTDTGDGIDADEICRRIIVAASQPFEVTGAQAYVGASIGLVFPDGDDVGRVELQRRADVALYAAKNEGRGCYRIFTEAFDANIRHRRQIEAELRQALASGTEFEIHYQPLVATHGEGLVAMEALVRWHNPRLGLLLPAEFIGIADESGLINPLGEWVLDHACRTMSEWPDISLAVNVSAVQMRSEGFADRVLAIVKESGLRLDRLQLEVTESAILDAEDGAAETLRRLRAAGIQIVLDDFGTSYSSLAHLRKLEVDKVKIDRSFVQNLGQAEDSGAIVQAVATLGRSLGISVTAEGVETDDQRTFLRVLGCTELQGHLLSRPLTERDAVAYMQEAVRRQHAA